MKNVLMGVLLWSAALQGAEPANGVEGLSDGIRSLLVQEMLEIEKGMHAIFSYMVRGEYAPIVETATNIQNSFIFKKSLTDAQRRELKGALPPAFIALDRSFHETAGDLAAAAEFEDQEKVAQNFAAMTRKCVQCHSTFATHRFTTFSE